MKRLSDLKARHSWNFIPFSGSTHFDSVQIWLFSNNIFVILFRSIGPATDIVLAICDFLYAPDALHHPLTLSTFVRHFVFNIGLLKIPLSQTLSPVIARLSKSYQPNSISTCISAVLVFFHQKIECDSNGIDIFSPIFIQTKDNGWHRTRVRTFRIDSLDTDSKQLICGKFHSSFRQ